MVYFGRMNRWDLRDMFFAADAIDCFEEIHRRELRDMFGEDAKQAYHGMKKNKIARTEQRMTKLSEKKVLRNYIICVK